MRCLILFLNLLNPVQEVGIRYLEQKDYEKAYQIFSQIYSVSKGSQEGGWAKYYMAVSLLGLGDTATAIGNILSLRNEILDDSLAYNAYGLLLSLTKNPADSIYYIYELVSNFPISPARQTLIERILQSSDTTTRISLLKILASDYENKKNELMLAEALLEEKPGVSLILAERYGNPAIRMKSLYKTGKYIQFFYTFLKENPGKILPQEAVYFIEKTGYSPLLIANSLSLSPENEKTAFEFSRILEQQKLYSSRFLKNIKDTLFKAYFKVSSLSLEELQNFEALPPSSIRNYILARGYLAKGFYVKSLNYAFLLPDSTFYNAFKIELVDTLLAHDFATRELLELLKSINLYYPLSERDRRIEAVILKIQDRNSVSFSSFLSNPQADTLVIQYLFTRKKYKELIDYSKGKILPNSMKPFIAEALYSLGLYREALDILEAEPHLNPGIFLRALLELENPESYIGKIPKKLTDEDAYYLYKLSLKIGKPELLNPYQGKKFTFYRAVLSNNLEEALKFFEPSDKMMVQELCELLSKNRRYQEILNITSNLNPLYPQDLKLFEYRLKALFELGQYQELLLEVKGIPVILPSNIIYDLAALSAFNLREYDLAFLFSLTSTSDTSRRIFSKCLLTSGYTDLVDTINLENQDKITYYFMKKSTRDLINFLAESSEEARAILKSLSIITGKVPDSLFNVYSQKFGIEWDYYYVLKGFSFYKRNEVDSLKNLLSKSPIQDPEMSYLASQLFLESGDVSLAKEILTQTLDLAPDTLKHYIYFRLGNISATSGDYNSAIFFYTKALEYGKTYEKEILYNLSIAFKNINQLDTALAYLERIVKYYSYDKIAVEASILMGFLLVDRQADIDKAINILEEVIGAGTKEQDCEALYWLAKAYITKQELRKALSILKRIYTYYTEFADWRDTAKLDAAKIFVYYNHREIAKKLYNEIIKMRSPDDPASQQAKEEMEFFKL
ncbi:MAG: tetratricopeptide repeat protein [Candidatus Hydrothermia bacterium]